MKFKTVTLGELALLKNGKAFKPTDWSSSGGLPIIRIQNLNGSEKPFNYWAGPTDSQVIVAEHDLLLAWSGTPGTSFGAHIWRGSKAVLNQHIFRVDLNEARLTKSWAKLVINFQLSTLIGQAHGGVGLQHVTKPMVESLEIPLPPLAEQKRIAAVLDAAEALRAKRRAATKNIGSLPRSLFLEMFGDPMANSRGWKRVALGNLLWRIDSGWSPVCLDRPVHGSEWGVLKLGAVTRCEYNPIENKALPPGVSADESLEVKHGDLLFSRKNTYQLVAACALVDETPPRLQLSDLIFRLELRPDGGICPEYLHELLIFPTKRRDIQKLAGGSSGSMPNISKEKLRKVLIEVPPLSLQLQFAHRLSTIRRLRKLQRASLGELDALFASLQQRGFRGEL